MNGKARKRKEYLTTKNTKSTEEEEQVSNMTVVNGTDYPMGEVAKEIYDALERLEDKDMQVRAMRAAALLLGIDIAESSAMSVPPKIEEIARRKGCLCCAAPMPKGFPCENCGWAGDYPIIHAPVKAE